MAHERRLTGATRSPAPHGPLGLNFSDSVFGLTDSEAPNAEEQGTRNAGGDQPRRSWATHKLSLGIFLSLLPTILDSNLINVSIRTVATDLNGLEQQGWLIVSSLLALTIAAPICRLILSKSNLKTIYLQAILIALVGELGSTLAQSAAQFLASRVVQGLAFGMLTVASSYMVNISTVRFRRNVWMAITGAILVGTVASPILAGLLADSWRAIFAVSLLISIASLYLLKTSTFPSSQPGDREKYIPSPLVEFQYFLRWGMAKFQIVEGLVGATLACTWTILPQYVQIFQRGTPLDAGLLAFAAAFSFAIGSASTGPLTSRHDQARNLTAAIGTLLTLAGFIILFTLDAQIPSPLIVFSVALLGIGFGLVIASIRSFAGSVMPQEQLIRSTPVAFALRNLIIIISVLVIMPAYSAERATDTASETTRIFFIIASAVILVGLGVFLSIRLTPRRFEKDRPDGGLDSAVVNIDRGLQSLFTRLGPPPRDQSSTQRRPEPSVE